MSSNALAALQSIDFDWTMHIDSIWRDQPYDVPGLQESLRNEALTMLERLFASSSRGSPLGMVLVGPGGSGKTHLLSLLRSAAVNRNAFFVLVDMTDVREFWDTTLLGYIRSLTQGAPTQQERLVRGLAQLAGGAISFEKLRSGRPPKLINLCNSLIAGLRHKHPELHEHQDVLRALVLLGSDDYDILDLGWKWLQAIGIEDSEMLLHGFQKSIGTPRDIVRGLSYLMSLVGPTLLALDQLDAIVAELQLVSLAQPVPAAGGDMDPRHASALAIIQGIAKGLIALRDTTSRTQTLVACLEQTWQVLHQRALVTMADRFFPPLPLKPVIDPHHVQQLVEQRIAPAYREHGFVPAYATYPFRPGFFASLRGLSPREVLKRCDEHRWSCLRRGEVIEIDRSGIIDDEVGVDDDFSEAREQLQALLGQADVVERMLADEDEDGLDKLLETACAALVMENPVPEDIDVPVDRDFVGTGAFAPLHARIRVVYRAEAEREKHYAARFLQKANHIAFQARLKAAMTASGIDHAIAFRRLVVFRRGPVPGGPATARLLDELKARGGMLLEPTLDELRTLWALGQMLALGSTAVLVRDWLRSERIVSQLPSFANAASYLFADAPKRSNMPPQPTTAAHPKLDDSQPMAAVGAVA
ncbi:MAG TPA: ATP-binding protein, partial [Polyangiales bacterium]|nr:ATP-binding protein [Polyangiales bacterium]